MQGQVHAQEREAEASAGGPTRFMADARLARQLWHGGERNRAAGLFARSFDAEPKAWWNALEALRALRTTGPRLAPPPHRTLLFSPNYKDNAYQRNLYRRQREHGFRALPLDTFGLDASLAAHSLTPGLVVHQHWLKELYWSARSVSEGVRRVDRHVGALRSLKAFGATLCWTLHNLLDHDPSDLQRRVCSYAVDEMARVSDRIFVHSANAGEQLNAHCGCDLSSKFVLLEHSLYDTLRDETPASLPREIDAAKLAGRRVLLCMGMIRPYKGVPDLLRAFARVVEDSTTPNLHLIVAGRLLDPEVKPLLAGLRADTAARVTCIGRELSEGELVALSECAHASVTPYRSILTSGSFYLSTTFARPTLAPRRGMFPEVVVDGENGFLYDGTTEGLLHGLRRLAELPADKLARVGRRALETHKHLGVAAVSDRFFATLEGRA